jgi:hypothetical protein
MIGYDNDTPCKNKNNKKEKRKKKETMKERKLCSGRLKSRIKAVQKFVVFWKEAVNR